MFRLRANIACPFRECTLLRNVALERSVPHSRIVRCRPKRMRHKQHLRLPMRTAVPDGSFLAPCSAVGPPVEFDAGDDLPPVAE